jgi:hypothetical protein
VEIGQIPLPPVSPYVLSFSILLRELARAIALNKSLLSLKLDFNQNKGDETLAGGLSIIIGIGICWNRVMTKVRG